jgi:hypothetical protein
MGNPIIKFDANPRHSPPRWTPTDHNGILGWLAPEVVTAARDLVPAPDAFAKLGSTYEVTVQDPEVGPVRVRFVLHRAAGRYKGAKPFWSACWAEQVKENPLAINEQLRAPGA